jgi:hypothetical protein
MSGGARLQLKPQAVVLLAGGERYDRADKLGVDERTVRRWAADEGFAAEVRIVRGQALTEAASRLSDGLATAAATLVDLLDDADARVRLAAAREVLTTFCRVRDQHVLETRIAHLEARAADLAGGNGDCHAEGGTA